MTAAGFGPLFWTYYVWNDKDVTASFNYSGAGFGYHKIVINEKDNRINQQMEIAAATQQNVALQTAAQTNETIRNLETQ